MGGELDTESHVHSGPGGQGLAPAHEAVHTPLGRHKPDAHCPFVLHGTPNAPPCAAQTLA